MLTESSKPTMAKKASVVPAITPQTTLPSALVLNVMVRDRSPVPAPIAHRPMTMMIKRPDSSTQVSTTLIFTLSPTPRKFTAAITAMKTRPTMRDAEAAQAEPERIRKVRREGARRRRRRGDARAHDGEGDEEGDEVDAEGAVRVERGAGGLRILGDQLEVAERGQQRDDEGDEERQPHGAADVLGHLAGERIDAGAEDVADDEQQQQPRAHDPLQLRLGRRCCILCSAIALPLPWRASVTGRMRARQTKAWRARPQPRAPRQCSARHILASSAEAPPERWRLPPPPLPPRASALRWGPRYLPEPFQPRCRRRCVRRHCDGRRACVPPLPFAPLRWPPA